MGMPVRFFNSLMWQQGVDVIAADGTAASINTPEGLAAASFDQVHL
jgi:multiple sugar transport system substrate-binding protein